MRSDTQKRMPRATVERRSVPGLQALIWVVAVAGALAVAATPVVALPSSVAAAQVVPSIYSAAPNSTGANSTGANLEAPGTSPAVAPSADWADQLTVEAHIVVNGERLPESGTVDLAGIATEDAPSQPLLSLQFAKVSRGWFGTYWTVQLDGDASVLGSPVTLVASPNSTWHGSYQIFIGYDRTTGAAAIALYEQGKSLPLVARQLRLRTTDSPLRPWAPEPANQNRGLSPVQVVALDPYPGVIPFGAEWSFVQPGAGGGLLPTTRLNRRLPANFQIKLPWEPAQGASFELFVTSPGVQAPVTVWPVSQDASEQLPISDLPPGVYNASLHYTVGGRTHVLGEREFAVGAAEFRITGLRSSRVVAGRNDASVAARSDGPQENEGAPLREYFHLSGTIEIVADGPLPPVDLILEGELIAHVRKTDQWSTLTSQPASGERQRVLSQRVDLSQGAASMPFEASVALPTSGPTEEYWELRLHSTIDANPHLDSIQPVSAWLGPDARPNSWAGFLEDEEITHTPIAPGVDLYSIRGRLEAGPIQMYLLAADLLTPGLTVDALIPEYVTWTSSQWPRSHVSEMTRQAGAIAGINAAFFEISTTMEPRGTEIRSGELVKTAIPQWENAIAFSPDGAPYVGTWRWSGGVRRSDGTAFRPTIGLNVPLRGNNQLAVYSAPPPMRSPGSERGFSRVVELVVGDLQWEAGDEWTEQKVRRGRVLEVREQLPGVALNDEIVVVTGTGTSADYLLQTFTAGDPIDIVYELSGTSFWPYLDDWRLLHAAVPTGVILLKNGNYGDLGVRSDPARHPRTAVGISWDQRFMYWLVVEGRSSRSVGMTYKELADFFVHVGVFHAVNLDGGGSSSLAIRDPQTMRVRVVNAPSDGSERLVPDGLGLFYRP